MSMSSSLAAGVSGLNANSQKLASISDNIANSSTFGYKRSVTDFHAMVLNGASSQGLYAAGGVRTTTERQVDEQGQIRASSNAMDIAINGGGFLPVARNTAAMLAGSTEIALATTGSFTANADGTLVNASGFALMGWPAQLDGTFPSFPRDTAAGLQPVNIFHNQFAANPTTEMTLGLNLPYSSSVPGNLGVPEDMTLEYFGNLGQTETLKFTFTPSGTENEWVVDVVDSANGGSVGNYTMTFADAAVGGGKLASVTTNAGGAYDPATGTFDLAVGGGTITVNIGEIGGATGITQLDTTFAPSTLTKNGSAVGNLKGVEIDTGGTVRAIYDGGFTRPIYRVPVVDVPNPNGLIAGEAQTFGVSRDSGSMFLWDAGTGPVGQTLGYAQEASTTDVAHELTELIQTQRAYSTNAKVIQTVDEMLQETTNLKR